MDTLSVAIIAFIAILILGECVYLLSKWRKRKPNLYLQFYLSSNKIHHMNAQVLLDDLNQHTVAVIIQDTNGNQYGGTLGNWQLKPADASQDSVAADTTTANLLDVTALTASGGTSVGVTADFTSSGNGTPASGSTAIAIADGTVIKGLTGTLTLVNNALSLNFKQAS